MDKLQLHIMRFWEHLATFQKNYSVMQLRTDVPTNNA